MDEDLLNEIYEYTGFTKHHTSDRSRHNFIRINANNDDKAQIPEKPSQTRVPEHLMNFDPDDGNDDEEEETEDESVNDFLAFNETPKGYGRGQLLPQPYNYRIDPVNPNIMSSVACHPEATPSTSKNYTEPSPAHRFEDALPTNKPQHRPENSKPPSSESRPFQHQSPFYGKSTIFQDSVSNLVDDHYNEVHNHYDYLSTNDKDIATALNNIQINESEFPPLGPPKPSTSQSINGSRPKINKNAAKRMIQHILGKPDAKSKPNDYEPRHVGTVSNESSSSDDEYEVEHEFYENIKTDATEACDENADAAASNFMQLNNYDLPDVRITVNHLPCDVEKDFLLDYLLSFGVVLDLTITPNSKFATANFSLITETEDSITQLHDLLQEEGPNIFAYPDSVTPPKIQVQILR